MSAKRQSRFFLFVSKQTKDKSKYYERRKERFQRHVAQQQGYAEDKDDRQRRGGQPIWRKKDAFGSSIDYDKVIKRIPHGKLLTIERIRNHLAYQYDADFTCPLTAGVFTGIVAWASHQRTEDITPYWRVVKNKGELNPKFPGGIEAQKQKLEAEGHSIVSKGKKNLKYYVKDYEQSLFQL